MALHVWWKAKPLGTIRLIIGRLVRADTRQSYQSMFAKILV